MVVREFGRYLRDLERQQAAAPDLIVVATDANCKGRNERLKEFRGLAAPVTTVFAIPDPHIERWLLLDGAAFRRVFGQGCNAPDLKCDRDKYKRRLIEAIRAAGVAPNIGGLEYAEDIARAMNVVRAARADLSFRRFVEDLDAALRRTRLTVQ